jgi:phage FluMu protein Com
MKRIVTCPKCEAKLAVFDLGKPINQKCPKCGNAFVIESEENKEAVKTAEATDSGKSASDGAKKAEASTSDVKAGTDVKAAEDAASKGKPAAKSDAIAPEKKDTVGKKSEDADKPSDTSPDKKEPAAKGKEIALKKPVERPGGTDKPMVSAKREPVASAALDSAVPPAAGPSPLFSMVVAGLLILVIVMQVMMKVRADKQYRTLIEHLQYIEKNLK